MLEELFTLPHWIIFLIILLVNARIGALKSEVKELKEELRTTKMWLRDELYEEKYEELKK